MTLCTTEPWNCGGSPASGGVEPVMRMIGTVRGRDVAVLVEAEGAEDAVA